MHRRTKIRKQVIKMLQAEKDLTAKIFPNLSTSVMDDDLPCIKVYPQDEDAEKYAETPRELKRIIGLRIEIIASGPEEPNETDKVSLEDQLDDIAEQVECALSRDDSLGNTADDIILTSTVFDFEGGGAQPIASCRLSFAVTYHQTVPDSIDKQSGVEDLKRAHINYHVGHDDEEPDLDNTEAEDDVVLPQS